jgi:hypothetical protein
MILDFSSSGFKNRYLVTWPEFPVNFFQNIQAALVIWFLAGEIEKTD